MVFISTTEYLVVLYSITEYLLVFNSTTEYLVVLYSITEYLLVFNSTTEYLVARESNDIESLNYVALT